jgi:catechol-2,3-dioxygenase
VADFYSDLLRVQIVRHSRNLLAGEAVLLSGHRGEEAHELVLLTNPGAEHIAFGVDTKERLRGLYRGAKQRGLAIPYALDTGIALGLFVRDPEGDAIEIYFPPGQPPRDTPPLNDPDPIDRLILAG